MERKGRKLHVRILRFIFTLTILINSIIFPVSYVITSSEKVNNILDQADLEQFVLDIYFIATLGQIKEVQEDESDDVFSEIEDELRNNLIDKEELREQRVVQITEIFFAIENGKVPVLKLELRNPLSVIKESISEEAQGVVDKLTQLRLCKEDETLGKVFDLLSDETLSNISLSQEGCVSIGDVIDKVTGESEDTEEDKLFKPTYEIETSFGIDEQSIVEISQYFRIFKYGPMLLTVINLIILTVLYLFTLKDSQFASRLLRISVVVSIVTAALWLIVPWAMKIAQPVKLGEIPESADLGGLISDGLTSTSAIWTVQTFTNTLITTTLFEIAKNAYIIPLLFLLITGFVVLIYKVIEKTEDSSQNTKSK